MKIQVEQTPNPATLKFVLDRPIATMTLEISNVENTDRSPLAKKLFGFPWMSGVFIGPDFVSITKQDWVDWDVLAQPLADLIAHHFERGELAITELPDVEELDATEDILPTDSEIVQKIKKIINAELRPAVALDGGDVRYSHFDLDTGVLRLEMRGACSGCPSKSVTLKNGIEVRIRQLVPEVTEVIAD